MNTSEAPATLAVRVLKFEEAMEFRMGASASKCFVHPGMGARLITLNYAPSVAGYEFPQHIHDESDDTIVGLKGQADLRQGDSRRRFQAGHCVLVPAGEIHGTITMEDGTELISFQTPPDMALYSGGRDSSRLDAAPVNGRITPGAVKYVEYGFANGVFLNRGAGAERIEVGYRQLKPGDRFSLAVSAEAVVFVWKGAVEAGLPSASQTVQAKDALFAQGQGIIELYNAGHSEAVFIHAVAPPLAD